MKVTSAPYSIASSAGGWAFRKEACRIQLCLERFGYQEKRVGRSANRASPIAKFHV
jgi:hypothetical protein